MEIPETNKIYLGDALSVLRTWPNCFVNTCVTSPPYWGLRDYGVDGQMGLEKTPEEYVLKMVKVFHEVRRILRNDGTLWLNLGDCWCSAGKGGYDRTRAGVSKNGGNNASDFHSAPNRTNLTGIKNKDLVGIPWMLAFALREDGWFLRSDIIWSKPNPMPESVTDRPTKSHEYIFLLSKSEHYFYDNEAIKERAIYFDDNRQARANADHKSMPTEKVNGIRPVYKDARSFDGKHSDKQRGHSRRHAGFNDRLDFMSKVEQCAGMRNKRSVWTVATRPFTEAHFATFPDVLIRPCVMAGSPVQGIVLDPFIGAGTTALAALNLNRRFLGIELNPRYIDIAEKRIASELSQKKLF